MRGASAIPLVAVLLAACSTTPVYLTDLEDRAYLDSDSVIEQLDCSSVIVTFHIGQGVATEQEAIEASGEGGDPEMFAAIEQAKQLGTYLWVLATETGQVIGTVDSRGGITLCVQDMAAA